MREDAVARLLRAGGDRRRVRERGRVEDGRTLRLGGERARAVPDAFARGVQDETDARRVLRALDLAREAAFESQRTPDARFEPEDVFRQLGGPGDQRAAAREDHARREVTAVAAPLDLDRDELQDLFHARLDDARERALRDGFLGPPADPGNLDLLLRIDQADERGAELALQRLGLIVEHAQALADVVGDFASRDADHGGVPDGLVLENRDVGRAAADVHEHDADFLFIVVQNSVRTREGFQHNVVHAIACLFDAAVDVFRRAHEPGDDVDVRLQTDAAHPDGIGHAVLSVHDELLREYVQDFAVGGHRDVARVLQQTLHIAARDLAARDRDHASALEALDVVARDADADAFDRHARSALGLADGLADGLDGFVDVDDDAAVQPVAVRQPDAADVEAVVIVHRRDDGANFCGADIDAHDETFLFAHVSSWGGEWEVRGNRSRCQWTRRVAPGPRRRWWCSAGWRCRWPRVGWGKKWVARFRPRARA